MFVAARRYFCREVQMFLSRGADIFVAAIRYFCRGTPMFLSREFGGCVVATEAHVSPVGVIGSLGLTRLVVPRGPLDLVT